MKIYKYELQYMDYQEIVLPQGYKILDIQMQWSQLVMWAMIDPARSDTKACIKIYSTGEEIYSEGKYISTFQANGGATVGHAFEV